MVETIDLALLHWINQDWSSSFLDAILIPARNKYVWIPLYVFIIAFSLINFGKKGYYVVLFLILTVGAADAISNYGFKKNFQRLRPCRAIPEQVSTRVSCGSGYSFTSNHAANHFALATFISLLLGKNRRRWQLLILLWAAIVSVSQVYVGVHYPTDILAGGILGYFIARLMYLLFRRLDRVLHL